MRNIERWVDTFNESISPKRKEEYRKFHIEEISYNNRQVTVVSLETVNQYLKNPEIVPSDWSSQIAQAMDKTSLLFLEYFPHELERTAFSSRITGSHVKEVFTNRNVSQMYGEIATHAKQRNIPVASCDTANKLGYLFHEGISDIVNGGFTTLQFYFDTGVYYPRPNWTDVVSLHTVEAKRMFTAQGIMQEAERYPEGSSFLYVGAPAHASRIAKYISKGFTHNERGKYDLYKKFSVGLDTNTRIYKPYGDSWIRVSDAKIN